MKLIFTLPGEWTSPWILLRLLEVVESDWQATEAGFTHVPTGAIAQLAIANRVDGLDRIFAEGTDPTRPPLDDALLAEVADHKAVIQVSVPVDDQPPLDALHVALSATNAVIDGGALAVHVGTSGLVHGADAFQALFQALEGTTGERERLRAYAALTVRYRLGARSTTLGLHALGRPDVLLTAPLDVDRAVAALERAAFGPNDPAPPDDRGLPGILHNPFGLRTIAR